MTKQMINFWNEMVDFEEKVKKELQPKLNIFIGEEFDDQLQKKVQNTIDSWLLSLDQVIFNCQVDVELKNVDGIEIIEKIEINPFYF